VDEDGDGLGVGDADGDVVGDGEALGDGDGDCDGALDGDGGVVVPGEVTLSTAGMMSGTGCTPGDDGGRGVWGRCVPGVTGADEAGACVALAPGMY
jgi:hypothetical protein